MNELKTLPNSHVAFELHIDSAAWSKANEQALEKVSKEIKIDGFRAGKAPREKVLEQVNPDYLKDEALHSVLVPAYAAFVKEHKLDTVAMPHVDVKIWEPTPIIEVEVAVKPEVDLAPLAKVKVKQETAKVENKEVEETLENLRKRFAEYKATERGAKNGDRIEIDFTGHDLATGAEVPGTTSKNHPLILGEGYFLADFEKNLLGKKAGDKFDFELTFPADYHAEKMAGQKVKFSVEVKLLSEPTPPTDEVLAQKLFGEEVKSSDLKKKLEEDMKEHMQKEEEQKAKDKVLEEFTKVVTIEIPSEMLDQELEQVREEREHFFHSRGLTLELFCEQNKMTIPEYEKTLQETARKQVQLRLILDKIMQTDAPKLEKADEDKLAHELEHTPEEKRAQMRPYYENRLLVDKILARFIS